jgi:hypothetical protein
MNLSDSNLPNALGVNLRISRVNPDNIRYVAVNDFMTTHDQGNFYFTFSMIEPPLVTDDDSLHQLTEIEAIATSKIVVTPDFAEKILQALSINIERYRNEQQTRT